jgi:hypothetical protein
VASVVTDRGILRRLDGELRVAAVPSGAAPLAERVHELRARCGWEPEVAAVVEELDPVAMGEVLALRDFDRERVFLA